MKIRLDTLQCCHFLTHTATWARGHRPAGKRSVAAFGAEQRGGLAPALAIARDRVNPAELVIVLLLLVVEFGRDPRRPFRVRGRWSVTRWLMRRSAGNDSGRSFRAMVGIAGRRARPARWSRCGPACQCGHGLVVERGVAAGGDPAEAVGERGGEEDGARQVVDGRTTAAAEGTDRETGGGEGPCGLEEASRPARLERVTRHPEPALVERG